MGASASMSLGTRIAIILGVLVVVAFAAGLAKLYMNKKRRLRKKAAVQSEEVAAMKMNDREKLVGKKLEDGSLSGGATQLSNSPAPSYVLSQSTTIVNWGEAGKNDFHSASSSVVDLQASMNGSVSSLLAAPEPGKNKPSPLRLNPINAELNGSGNNGPASSLEGSRISSLPSPRSTRSFANPQAEKGWVSPVDVHFSRPTTANANTTSARPQLPGDLEKSMLAPTASGSVDAINSESASIFSSDASSPAQAKELPPDKSSFNNSSQEIPYQAAKGFNQNSVTIPSLPQSYFGPSSLDRDPNQFSERAMIRNSMVSKQSTSVFKPERAQRPSSDTSISVKSHIQGHSRQPSSIYSTTLSTLEVNKDKNQRSHTTSRFTDARAELSSRSRSTSSKRSNLLHGLSPTHGSLRYSYKPSQSDPRPSREPDQMQYDPTSHRHNRSRSFQGGSDDFDYPRQSPFSNTNAVFNHSASSSLSFSLGFEMPQQKQETIHKPTLELDLPERDRLSVMTRERGRSDSETSQGSIGEFYDAYYRQSILALRASQASQAQTISDVQGGASGDDGRGNFVK